MSSEHEPSTARAADARSDVASWARAASRLKVSEVPTGAINLNVDGRRAVGPLQGFGPLWQKTFRMELPGVDITPAEVIRVWKERFPEFHPPQNRFYPSMAGVVPGEIVLINATMTGLPVYTGVVVLYADDESFAFMTSDGLPESGWITFSAFEEDGTVVAQVQTMARANDPIYELFFRLYASNEQNKIWTHVLRSLGAYFGVEGKVELTKILIDPKCQWRQAKNVWQNAGARSMLYATTKPLRWAHRRLRGR
jgi:hypothetical protein